MLKTSTRTLLGRALGLTLLAALTLASAPASADETYVVDRDAGPGSNGALFRVDPASGFRTLVSDFGNPAQGPLGRNPHSLALEAGGTVLVIDLDAGTSFSGALFRVDPASGFRTLVSDFGNPAQGPLGSDPIGLVKAGGTVLVIDSNGGTGGLGALVRVDAISGDRSLVSDFGNPSRGPLGSEPHGLALEASGRVLVIDFNAGTGGLGALFRVDPAGGFRTLVSDFGNPAQGPLGDFPLDLALEADGTVLVIARDAGTGGDGALFRMDAISGNRTLVSDFGNPAQGPLGPNPHGLALEADGAVLVIDEDAGTGGGGALFRIARLSGLRNLVSDFDNAGQGDLGVTPVDVAVVVPNCYGRVPTIVGDNGNNVLIGSRRADVILGRAGADRIDGRGGNDRICGGDGNDTLRGRSGNDRVNGGAGADTLEGGTGDDRLDGGAGTDLIAGGKGTDRCKSGAVQVDCER